MMYVLKAGGHLGLTSLALNILEILKLNSQTILNLILLELHTVSIEIYYFQQLL